MTKFRSAIWILFDQEMPISSNEVYRMDHLHIIVLSVGFGLLKDKMFITWWKCKSVCVHEFITIDEIRYRNIFQQVEVSHQFWGWIKKNVGLDW